MRETFKTIEDKLCYSVMGLSETEAKRLIREADCVPFVEQRDKDLFYPSVKTGHSYRINLTIRKGKVTGTNIG